MIRKLLNLFIPHFFLKEEIPPIKNSDLLETINDVKNCHSLHEAMTSALQILSSKYQSKRFETYLFFHKLYEKDPNKLWKRSGFMHCTQQNYLFRVLLVKSGWLKEEQIQLGFSLIWYISPHQFLKIILPKGKIAVDPWNYAFGVPFGRYASGFGSKRL
ncbi:MAG TPA: hypothetical protein VLH19_01020 [Patescibacteria group bacterium]|nr:hypothetical protein [Patescibacteria group bacterium]